MRERVHEPARPCSRCRFAHRSIAKPAAHIADANILSHRRIQLRERLEQRSHVRMVVCRCQRTNVRVVDEQLPDAVLIVVEDPEQDVREGRLA